MSFVAKSNSGREGGGSPIGANLGELDGTGCSVATGDRKGREGASPSSTLRRADVPRATPRYRCVADGLAPSRPLRSLVAPSPSRASKFALMGTSPPLRDM